MNRSLRIAVALVVTGAWLLSSSSAAWPAVFPHPAPGDVVATVSDGYEPPSVFSPWYGSITSDVALYQQQANPPVVYQDPANSDVNSGNRAKVYMAIRDAIHAYSDACAFGPPNTTGPAGCNAAPTKIDWSTQLCDEIFQALHKKDDSTKAIEKALGCWNATEGTLTVAQSGQCLDFDFLVDPSWVQWSERVDWSVFTSHYRFTVRYQLDLRFELCNNGLVDASDPTSSPLSVSPYYNPDHLPDCYVPDGSGGYQSVCGITVTFRNVSSSHTKTDGTIDLISHGDGGNAGADQQIVDGFTSERRVLDPSSLGDTLGNMNAQLRAGAQKIVTLLHTAPSFLVKLSVNGSLDAAPAAPVGPFPLASTLPGELNVELSQVRYARIEVAGSTGCNSVSSASVRVVGHSYLPNHVVLLAVHDATRTVPNAGGIFHTDASGDFDSGDLPINARNGDRLEAFAGDGTNGATGVLDPITECIP
jgi:hypothetical protein